MRAVIQRVISARLSVSGEVISEIGKGLVVFFGVKKDDSTVEADYVVRKIPTMRIFEDESGKMNLSVTDIGGEILFVSQFTLYGDCKSGNRPSFTTAEAPDKAVALYDYAAYMLSKSGASVKKGIFGADMKIEQINDGPVTILLDTDQIK